LEPGSAALGTISVEHLTPFHHVALSPVLLDQLGGAVAALAVALGALDAEHVELALDVAENEIHYITMDMERTVHRRIVLSNLAESDMADDLDRALSDAKKRAEGVAKEVKGAARDVYGQARDSAAEVADSAADALTKTASSFERALRKTIEEQPYTALLIGIGIGWLLGRSHRPF
jgi:ElaB/YqjD/DUF883 family membrane-anchored ribosome-binding protein